MKHCSLTFYRLLCIAHIAVAIVLLPLNLFFGFFSLLIVMPGLIWLVILGFKLWQPNAKIRMLLRNTHFVLVIFSVLLIFYGLYALHAAQISANAGGGLLGAFGLIPILLGLLAGCLSIVSLCVSYSVTLKNISGISQKIENSID
jgi:hypothetical protein